MIAKKELSDNAKKDLQIISVLTAEASTERDKQKAFSCLYTRYQASLNFFFLKFLRDKEDVEELTIATLSKAFEKINSYDDSIGAFSTWLFKIAKNLMIDHKKKNKAQFVSIDEVFFSDSNKSKARVEAICYGIKSEELTPEQEIIHKQNIASVHSAISKIKNNNVRRLMTYRFIDELSFEEIAKLEGVKDCSTLRVRSKRGKKILAELLS